MKILILEDDPFNLHTLNDMMRAQGHSVLACSRLVSAIEYIKNEEPIDLVVVDLNMSTIGFTKEQTMRSQGGTLSGWIYLIEYVFTKYENIPCIVFSEFIDELKYYLDETPNEKKFLNNVTLVQKNDIDVDFHFKNTVNRVSVAKKESVNHKTVFLSFCTRDSDIADIVEQRLKQHFGRDISITRWEKDVGYRENFKEFMDSAKSHDFMLSIISDQYLKSRACMYEVGRIIDESSFKEKLLYIVLSDDDNRHYKNNLEDSIAAKVYNLTSHFDYTLYWKNEYETLSRQVDIVGLFVVNSEYKSLINETQKIINDIQKFLMFIYYARGIPFSELMDTDFKAIKDAINAYF